MQCTKVTRGRCPSFHPFKKSCQWKMNSCCVQAREKDWHGIETIGSARECCCWLEQKSDQNLRRRLAGGGWPGHGWDSAPDWGMKCNWVLTSRNVKTPSAALSPAGYQCNYPKHLHRGNFLFISASAWEICKCRGMGSGAMATTDVNESSRKFSQIERRPLLGLLHLRIY